MSARTTWSGCRNNRVTPAALWACASLFLAHAAISAEAVLIRHATVHTSSTPAVLENTDVLIENGRIAQLGRGLIAPEAAEVIEAAGKPLTAGLFGGLGHLGIEEIGIEPPAEDYALRLGSMRPEFDVTLAFNPESIVLGVNRLGGITFAMVAPSSEHGGTIVAGQGSVALLDGQILPRSHALFIAGGGDANALSGGSRAAQFMLLEQALAEVRSPKDLLPNDARLLTPAGRRALLAFLEGASPIVFNVDRASDIRQVLALAQREKLHVIIQGGAEAWRVAPELAAAHVPVILNPLDDLPESFDTVGATLENAARLHRANVKIAFSLDDTQPHNMRKVRQTAGIAVAHGLPWEAALAALTRNPAEMFGVADRVGSIARGRPADLVLWSGDPLEVTTLAERVFIDGKPQPMQSRQTLLRDRYLERLRAHAAR